MAETAGLNLDLPYIDYPTGWAIQKGYDLDHHDQCSAKQTDGAFLCDCNGLIYKWADLKWKHERSKARTEVLAEIRAEGEARHKAMQDMNTDAGIVCEHEEGDHCWHSHDDGCGGCALIGYAAGSRVAEASAP